MNYAEVVMGWSGLFGLLFSEATKAGWLQHRSNEGFEDAKAGRPPIAFFGAEECRVAYNEGYARGQQAAQTEALKVLGRRGE